MAEPILSLADVVHTYTQGARTLEVLRGASLTVGPGEVVALVGPSGAGKSTLLHVAGLLERPTAGTVMVAGDDLGHAPDRRRTAVRLRSLGFVYQYHHLLPEFTALENVVLPQLVARMSRVAAEARAETLLEQVGLGARAQHRPAELSGGEQQRVAVARALANRPTLLLADEPTGNLDPDTAGDVFGLLLDLARREGLAALVATHNPDLAKRMDRIVVLKEGLLTEQVKAPDWQSAKAVRRETLDPDALAMDGG